MCKIWTRSDHRRRLVYRRKDTHTDRQTDRYTHTLLYRYTLAGIPIDQRGNHQVSGLYKYRIIILIIIIISLGQIFYRIIANTSRMHTRTCAYTHTRTHTAVAAVIVRRTGYRYYSVSPNRDCPLRLRQC